MRVLPLILLLCLGTGIGTAWACWPADEAPPPMAADAPSNAVGDAVASELDAVLPAVAAADASITASPDEAGDEQRVEVTPDADPRRGPVVQVVRGQPPQPVADAEVFFVTEADAAARQRLQGAQCTRFEWPERYGQRQRSDPMGFTTLPPSPQPWLVAAVHGGEFAFRSVGPGGRPAVLALQTDETVSLLATDDDGEPGKDLPIALLRHQRGEEEAAVLWQGRTGADGRAECRHFQVLRPDHRGPADAERFAAMLVMTLPVPAFAEFAGRPAPRDTVRIRVPATTRVDVLLTDHRGTPLLTPAAVALWVERPRDWKAPFPVPGGLDRPRLTKPTGAGPVAFEHVATNSPVRAAARFPSERRGAMSGPLTTSPDPRQPLAVQLPLGPDLALLAGRIVTEDGTAFGPRDVTACLWRADRPVGQLTVSTIADGRFDLVQRPLPDAPELWLELRAKVPGDFDVPIVDGPGAQAIVMREVGARVRFSSLQPGERRELGTIVLGELPPICSGVVVDDLGAPIADAEVKLQRHEPEPVQAPQPGRGQPQAAQNPPRDPWRDLPLLSTRTDAEGWFVLGGEPPRGELRVRADSGRHFADATAVRHPGQQVRIVLQRNGILRGRVLLPDWIPDGSVTMTLRPFDETVRARDTRSIPLSRGRGGRITIEPLRPGRYDAIVVVRNVAEPLCVLGDLFVTPGEVRDGRLRPLDLRQSLFRYRLRAVDAGGRLLPLDGPILARLRKQDGGVADAGFRWQKGRAELITGSTIAEVVAFGKNCEPTALTLGPGDHDVYMRQVVPAQVYLPGARALCGPERRVRVSVVLTEETGFPQWLQGVDQRTGEQFSFPRWELGKSSGAWLGPTDDVEVPVARSGKYEVVLRIHATDSERSPQASVPLGVHELRVDGSLLAPVTVPVDTAAVQRALAQLQRQVQRAGQPRPGPQTEGPQPRGNRGR